jgi:hypothetical protein
MGAWPCLTKQILHFPNVSIGSGHFQINTSFYILHILLTLIQQFMPLNFYTASVACASDSTAPFSLALLPNFAQNLTLILGAVF